MIADMTQRFPEGQREVEERRESLGITLRQGIERYEQDAMDGDFYNSVKVWQRDSTVLAGGIRELYNGFELSEVRDLHPELLDRELEMYYWHDIDIVFILAE